MKLLFPTTVSPSLFATVATATWPTLSVWPLLKVALSTPDESTVKPV